MTVHAPQYIQGLGTTAKDDRGLIADLVSSGVVPGGLSTTTTGVASRTSQVASGISYIDGTQNPNQGVYRLFSDASEVKTHEPAVSHPRWDIIIARVYDKLENGGVGPNQGTIEIVKGVENSAAKLGNFSGRAGELPANSERLASVLVPVGASPAIPSGNVVDERSYCQVNASLLTPVMNDLSSDKQAGVEGSEDWSTTLSMFAGSGEVQINSEPSAAGWTAWLPSGGGLVRTTSFPTVVPMKPPALPASGKFMSVGLQISYAGGTSSNPREAVLSLASGVEKATEAEAIANPAAPVSGHVRLRDFIVINTAGSYTHASERDRRPWARGASASKSRTSGSISLPEAFVLIDATNLALRVECSGVPVRLWLQASFESTATSPKLAFNFWANGAPVSEGEVYNEMLTASNSRRTADFSFPFTPPAPGSYLFQPTVFARSTAVELISTTARPIFFSVREDLRHSANNGTS